MIPITDARLRLLLLAELVRNPVGLTPEQARELRGLTAAELVKLSTMPEPRLTVTLDGSIGLGLKRVEAMKARDAVLEYMVCHGATADHIHELFGLHNMAVAAMRAERGLPGMRRPSMPKPREREVIARWWWDRMKGRKETAEDYVALHQTFPRWPIGGLRAVVHEYDEEPPMPAPPKRRGRRPKLQLVASAA